MNIYKYKINNAVADFKVIKEKNRYYILSNDNIIISSISFYDYNIENFDWILLANINTNKKYRNMGFASLLINTLYDDIKNYKGLYLLVDIKNLNAVKLYKKLGFNLVKKYKINKVIYYIMCKGSYDTDQFENIKFNN